MKPRGMLMTEHRQIEKIIAIIEKESVKIEKGKTLNPYEINKISDFMSTYTDLIHHGKEEDILFNRLRDKKLSEEDSKVMNTLIEEHQFSRDAIKTVEQAKDKFLQGENTIGMAVVTFNSLVKLYKNHIHTEDKIFFPASEKYFSEKELEEMMREFEEYDQTVLHKKYKTEIEQFAEAQR